MAQDHDYEPLEAAPETGVYELVNVLGSPAEVAVERQKGEPLPEAPRQFRWVLRKRLGPR